MNNLTEIFFHLTSIVLNSVGILLLIMFGYWFIISLFGFGKPKELPVYKPKKKFLLLIPAHNEGAVIKPLIENLLSLDYPKDLYDVVVIADNCTDNTAQLVRSAGAIALEHTSLPGELKGKPYAIQYALEQYDKEINEKYDAISIFDADNLVSKNYLLEMNKHLIEGHRLIQCYLDSKNPNDNWISLGYSASYYFMNRSWQLAKSRLRLGNAIGGTGFTVEKTLLKKVGWSARSLTEDLEFTMQCLLIGEKAYWSHEAKIYDEKPVDFKASCVQRLRWARGHWEVAFKYSFGLLKRAMKKGDFAAFDGFMYLINPAKIVATSLLDILLLVFTFRFVFLGGEQITTTFIPFKILAILYVSQFAYIYYSLKTDAKDKSINVFSAYWSMFLTNITYIPLFIWALITYKNKEWNPTEHKRSIQLEELDKVG